MSDLTQTLQDIAQTGADVKFWQERADDHYRYLETLQRPGPNNWSEVTEGDFGRFYDFEVVSLRDGRNVFRAASEAALQWAYAYLPENIDRYEADGFILERGMLDSVLQMAGICKLVDRIVAEQNEADQMAWEDA